jgi:hypothetical protein
MSRVETRLMRRSKEKLAALVMELLAENAGLQDAVAVLSAAPLPAHAAACDLQLRDELDSIRAEMQPATVPVPGNVPNLEKFSFSTRATKANSPGIDVT